MTSREDPEWKRDYNLQFGGTGEAKSGIILAVWAVARWAAPGTETERPERWRCSSRGPGSGGSGRDAPGGRRVCRGPETFPACRGARSGKPGARGRIRACTCRSGRQRRGGYPAPEGREPHRERGGDARTAHGAGGAGPQGSRPRSHTSAEGSTRFRRAAGTPHPRAVVGASGQGPEAWEQVEVLLDDHPDDPRLWLLAGESLRLTGKFDDSAAYLKRASEVLNCASARSALVDTLASARKFKEAADVLASSSRRRAVRWPASRAGRPSWPLGRPCQGRRGPGQGAGRRPGPAGRLLLKALLDAGDGHLDAAEQSYRRALAATPTIPTRRWALARLLIELRKLAEARTLLNEVWKQVEDRKIESDDAAVEVAQERATLELLDHGGRCASVAQEVRQRRDGTAHPCALGEYFRLREAYAEGAAFRATRRPKMIRRPRASKAAYSPSSLSRAATMRAPQRSSKS